jgi:predicted nuclease with RNAse H fold
VRTVGVDLAAEAKGTAVAVVEWPFESSPPGERARLVTLRVGEGDRAVLAALDGADRAGVDCPLGWPDPFVEFVVAHRTGHVLPPAGVDGLAWRRMLSRRATDHECHRVTGLAPLAVAADRIAAVAMRGAGLLGALHAAGRPVDRTGAGTVVECYPAAALKTWRLPHQAYKRAGGAVGLARLVDALITALPARL